MFPQDCQARLNQIYGQPVAWRSEFLQSVTQRQFLARMLTNLKYIYLQQQELEKALGTVEKILLLFPNLPGEVRDRGLIEYQLGNWLSAISDFESYLAQVPHAEDAPVIRKLLSQLGRS
jgi:regulator of sirC expression with transglutaminase-like and TPR domain